MDRKLFFNWYICAVLSVCHMIYSYDNAVFNATQGSKAFMSYNNNPGPDLIGGVNTAYTLAGIITQVCITGPLSRFTGRRAPLGLACVFVFITVLLQVLQPQGKIAYFISGRVFVGIAQGLCNPIAPVYISEIAPAHMRGRMVTIYQVCASVGAMFCFFVSFGASKNVQNLALNWDWRLIIILQIVAPAIVFVNLPFMPESPRWLMQHDKREAAEHAFKRIRSSEQAIQNEIEAISAQIEDERKNKLAGEIKPLWFDKSLRKRFILACCIRSGVQLCCEGTVNSYSTMIYKRVFRSRSIVQLISALYNLVGIFATLLAFSADKYGRRPLFLLGSLFMGIAMAIVATVYVATPTLADGTKPVGAQAGITTVFFLFVIAFKPSFGATTLIWCSEIFSTNVRGQAVSMSSAFDGATAAIIGQIFPPVFAKIGFRVFYVYFALNALLFVFVWFFIPESKGRTLEQMDEIFSVKSEPKFEAEKKSSEHALEAQDSADINRSSNEQEEEEAQDTAGINRSSNEQEEEEAQDTAGINRSSNEQEEEEAQDTAGTNRRSNAQEEEEAQDTASTNRSSNAQEEEEAPDPRLTSETTAPTPPS